MKKFFFVVLFLLVCLPGFAKYCIECGAELPDSAKFCSSCGKSQSEAFVANTARKNKLSLAKLKELLAPINELEIYGKTSPLTLLQKYPETIVKIKSNMEPFKKELEELNPIEKKFYSLMTRKFDLMKMHMEISKSLPLALERTAGQYGKIEVGRKKRAIINRLLKIIEPLTSSDDIPESVIEIEKKLTKDFVQYRVNSRYLTIKGSGQSMRLNRGSQFVILAKSEDTASILMVEGINIATWRHDGTVSLEELRKRTSFKD